MIDLHTHILPGLDDGPADMGEAVALCAEAARDGIETMVATPHMFDGVYDVARDDVLAGVKALQERLDGEGIPLEIMPGGETHITVDLPALLERGEALTLGDYGKYVLLELPHDVAPPGLEEFLLDLRLRGFRAVIAHAARNYSFQYRPERVETIVRAGHFVQITATILTGDLGRGPYDCAIKLLKEGLCHVVASDCHPGFRPPGLSGARKRVEKLAGRELADRIFDWNPRAVLAGRNISYPWRERSGGTGSDESRVSESNRRCRVSGIRGKREWGRKNG